MLKIYFATRVRGFFRQLFNAESISAKFEYDNSKVYETNSLVAKLKNKFGRSKIFDLLGIIQVIKCRQSADVYGSFNRFLDSDKPYFIYVENPTALFHYRLGRNKSTLGKKKITKAINSPNLRALIFMSKACYNTFESVCTTIPQSVIRKTIYPYIPINPLVNRNIIVEKSHKPELRLLYVAQGIRFISKGGLEIIDAFRKVRDLYDNISLIIITSIKDVENKIIDEIKLIPGLELHDFKFSFKEMQQIYADSNLMLQPTSDDSFGLTILEGIKSGLPIIGSRLYAIPEIVEDGINGYLCDPHYWFFDENNIPNPKIWNNRRNTIYSGNKSDKIINFLVNAFSR